ncbi:nose resistant to fluoxetine protein 6-like [Contarinia nasturtii]|uniref:nose resistant to fluoxetine protein 6-like n=1 Tax=Contarinia nasturtii TaxID=265458 RepID=UPI0012D4B237|nr:nose resistant to fluoxetine protein 6-like [Contarinia nasturtii]
MAKFHSILSMCFFLSSLNHFNCENTRSFFLDFEQIKYDLFLQSYTKLSQNYSESVNVKNKCLNELKAIQNGLISREQWALEIVDSWGKIPSGVFSGNTHDFGSFSQCLKIRHNDKVYETQYCLGRLFYDVEEKIASKLYRYPINNVIFPDMVHVNDLPSLDPRRPFITFGACMPAACSFEMFEQIVNDLIPNHPNNFSIELPNDVCQTANNDPDLTTKEKTTLGLLMVIFGLVLLSTGYDILCSIYNRKKSQVLLAFSFYTNGKKLFSLNEENTSETIQCLHGIRVLSTQWVVLCHTYALYLVMPIQNRVVHDAFLSKYSNMMIVSGFVAVDTFFVLSGLLVSIGILKHLEKKGRLNVLQLYVHRYLRLTPLLAISLLISVSLYRFGEIGPLWTAMIEMNKKQCENYWWSTLLYVQNYVNPEELCFGHSWYLSVDMQLFLISPAIVYLIYRFKLKALIPLTLLLLGCIYSTLDVHIKHNLTTIFAFEGNKFEMAYIPTHIRISSWLIGVFTGYLHFETRNRKIQIPKMINICGWALSLVAMILVIFINHPLQQQDNKFSPLIYGLYDAFSRIVWSIALCYIIFACVHGSGSIVNRFLSHPLWQPLSRMSYSIYLLHFVVIGNVMGTQRTPPYFTETAAFNTFIVNYVMTIFVSIIGTLTFESPIIVFEKILFNSSKKKITISTDIRNGIQQTDENNNIESSKKYQ